MMSPGGDPYGNQQKPPVNPYNYPSGYPAQPVPEQPGSSPYRQPRIQPYAPPQAPPPQAPRGSGGTGRGDSGGRPRTPSGLVRPYAMTGGRTRPRYQLAIEALVVHHRRPDRRAGHAARAPADLPAVPARSSRSRRSPRCCHPARGRPYPRGDLAEDGLVAIHQPGGDESAGGSRT